MATLPEDRVESAEPFSYCAVDLFDPFLIKEGRKELKRSGVLFTCMASRAVHIETANTLSTDSFINCLRRMMAIRGPIRQSRCDQGTNFVGAKSEFQREYKKMNHKKIETFLNSKGCDDIEFKMNVLSASHMGGGRVGTSDTFVPIHITCDNGTVRYSTRRRVFENVFV